VLPLIAIQIFERITFGTSYFGSFLKHRIFGFAPDAFDFQGRTKPVIDSLVQLTPGRYLSSAGSLDRAAGGGGISRGRGSAAPLSRPL